MKTRIVRVSFLVCMAVGIMSTVAFAADMFTGTWKLNIAKSTYGTGSAPKEPTISKYELTPDGMRLVSEGVSVKGKTAHSEYVFKFDGKDYPGTQTLDGKPNENAADQTISAKKVDDHTIEFTFKSKGTVSSHATAAISKDGKTETYTSTYMVDGKELKNITIWNRQ